MPLFFMLHDCGYFRGSPAEMLNLKLEKAEKEWKTEKIKMKKILGTRTVNRKQ